MASRKSPGPAATTAELEPLAARLRPTDTDDPAFRAFRAAIHAGASRQDIYVASGHGYAARAWEQSTDPIQSRQRELDTLREFERIREHAVNLVDPLQRHYGVSGTAVLEVGCGTGALAVALALVGAQVTAVDPTPESLQACRHRAEYFGVPPDQLHLQRVDARPGLPFPDRLFDRVIVNSVLEFIPDRRQDHVRDWVRLLRPAGLLVISAENGLFPRDYYTGLLLPRLRRRHCIAQNKPYGPTWLELRRWVLDDHRRVVDLSAQNRFNSIDKLAVRLRQRGRDRLARVLGAGNRGFKAACTALGLPADLFLPYATWVFEVDAESTGLAAR